MIRAAAGSVPDFALRVGQIEID